MRLETSDFPLAVCINIDSTPPARISIKDNAAGIFESEYGRAFRPAAIPPDRNGLSEFGMGLKSAACWFAPQWSVGTSAVGEPVSRRVHFDIANIVNDDLQELTIIESPEKAEAHYTEVVLEDPFHVPFGRTVSKLKDHLTDIYRSFIRDGVLVLKFNGEVLSYSEPQVLVAPYYKDPNSLPVEWRKDIEFDFGDGLRISGFAALREKANTSRAGFSLFRRGRVIQGSGDEGYRPSFIFGSSNSYRFQRLFGELNLEGFEVSHTKDGFRWDENEQPFLELLREHLNEPEMPLLKQAEGHRVRASRDRLQASANRAVANTADALRDSLPAALPTLSDAPTIDAPTLNLPAISTLATRNFEIEFRNKHWSVDVELTDDPAESQWLALSDVAETTEAPRIIKIRVSTTHPFMIRFSQRDPQDLEALLRVASAIAVAEVLARDAGVRQAGTIRRNTNDILLEALSGP